MMRKKLRLEAQEQSPELLPGASLQDAQGRAIMQIQEEAELQQQLQKQREAERKAAIHALAVTRAEEKARQKGSNAI